MTSGDRGMGEGIISGGERGNGGGDYFWRREAEWGVNTSGEREGGHLRVAKRRARGKGVTTDRQRERGV